MKKYLITGAGFGNKGAESMLYALISELRSHGKCEITVLTQHGFEYANHNIDGIKFIPYTWDERAAILHPMAHLYNLVGYRLCHIFGIHRRNELRLYRALKNTDVVLDISGYSLSSQWGPRVSHHIPHTLEIAKKFGKKAILLPQSFGPFDFPKSYKLSPSYLRNILGYAAAIFCREADGFHHIQALGGMTNIFKSADIVLQSQAKPDFVLTIDNDAAVPDIKPHSVLVVPNMRVIERTDRGRMMQLYRQTIDTIRQHGKSVYIAYYDFSDIPICRELKDMFADDADVVFLDQNLNSIQFNKILPGFDFMISSRFHSIVHGYRNGIPALVIGWAVKYCELLESVGQKHLLYDGRTEIAADDFLASVNHLIKNSDAESAVIAKHVREIQQDNCFDKMWEFI